jgi:carbonyl reductase 1
MSQQNVAVVTGANKGIGYAIVRGLALQFDGVVYLTGLKFE